MFQRRTFMAGLAAAAAGFAGRASAQAPGVADTVLRGPIGKATAEYLPAASDRKSKTFSDLLKEATRNRAPVFLPPGDYAISNIELPDGVHITGVAGKTRILYAGDGYLFAANEVQRVSFSNLVIDGGQRWLADYAPALIHARAVSEVTFDNCEIRGSSKHALQLERSGGHVRNCRIAGAADAGIYAVESTGMAIADNGVEDCGNGGILVHRWTKGRDATMVSGNRVQRIGAKAGGTGENGNGINVFRADNVLITGNHVSDCAFSAIRSNAGSDVQILNNQCLNSGETAIYSEFGFEGALVSGNLIDRAANGISIVNFDNGGRLAVVTGNIVRNLSATGPYEQDGGFGYGIAAEADTIISNNVVENAPHWGISLGWGPYLRNLVATGNMVRSTPVGCAVSVVEGAGSALIANNLFADVADGGVIGFRWLEKASAELADGAGRFDNLTVNGNRVVKA